MKSIYKMKFLNNKKIIITLILIFILVLLSTIAYARPITDIFTGGLLEINNFFESRQYEAYAKAIDFFFFALLFIAIYMMGARYAFKEIKRPEQVIVILLGLMTAFLLVLGGFSATLLLPYIHWLLYLLLFLFYWWILKGMKSKFWRFILALLLTLLTIGLAQGLLNALRVPEIGVPEVGVPPISAPSVGGISGYFKDLFGSFKGIEMPGVSMPGVPDWTKDLFGVPSAPTGPTTLPPVVTPEAPKEGGGWWHWWYLLIPLLILGGIAGVKRIRKPKTTKDKIIAEINGIITKKGEARDKIIKEQKAKNRVIDDATQTTKHVQLLLQEDLAYIWEEGKEGIREVDQDFLEFVKEQKDLVRGLIGLNNVEEELLKKIEIWKKFCIKNNVPESDQLVQELIKIVSLQNPQDKKNSGILYLITLCYHYEKAEHYYGKKINEILEGKLENLLKTKFEPVNWNENRLKALLTNENRIIGLIRARIELQIRTLKKIIEKLRGTTTPTPTPKKKSQKYAPYDPKEVKFLPPFRDPKKPDEKEWVPIEPLPAEVFVDLSPWFLKAKNQRTLGSCVSFASCAMYEYNYNREKFPETPGIDESIDVAELFQYYNTRKNKKEDEGTLPSVACEALKKIGVCKEELWPYDLDKFTKEPHPEAKNDAPNQRIRDYYVLDPEKSKFIRTLLDGLPILITILTHENFHMAIERDYIKDNEGTKLVYIKDKRGMETDIPGLHTVVVVGYKSKGKARDGTSTTDPNNGDECFKIRNSWDVRWGINGYIWINADYLMALVRSNLCYLIAPRILVGSWFKKKIPKNIKDKLAFLAELFKTLRNEENKENYIELAKNKINEFYKEPQGKDEEERRLYLKLVNNIEQGKDDKTKLQEAISALIKFRDRVKVHLESEGEYKVEFKGKERTRKIARKSVSPKRKDYFEKLKEVKKELDLLIEKLESRLKVEILQPQKEPKPIFYIGGQVYPLEAQAEGTHKDINTINNEKGYKFVWYIEQSGIKQEIHFHRKAEISSGIVPNSFKPGNATLQVVIYKDLEEIAENSIEVSLEKGGALVRRGPAPETTTLDIREMLARGYEAAFKEPDISEEERRRLRSRLRIK